MSQNKKITFTYSECRTLYSIVGTVQEKFPGVWENLEPIKDKLLEYAVEQTREGLTASEAVNAQNELKNQP